MVRQRDTSRSSVQLAFAFVVFRILSVTCSLTHALSQSLAHAQQFFSASTPGRPNISAEGLHFSAFHIGKCFCVRGGQEQRNLGPSHFRFLTNPGCDPHCVIYEEHGSKNHPGGLKDLRVDNKTVPCHAMPEQSPKCLVFLLNLYIKLSVSQSMLLSMTYFI